MIVIEKCAVKKVTVIVIVIVMVYDCDYDGASKCIYAIAIVIAIKMCLIKYISSISWH